MLPVIGFCPAIVESDLVLAESDRVELDTEALVLKISVLSAGYKGEEMCRQKLKTYRNHLFNYKDIKILENGSCKFRQVMLN